jgi:hypothetical protein
MTGALEHVIACAIGALWMLLMAGCAFARSKGAPPPKGHWSSYPPDGPDIEQVRPKAPPDDE